MKWLYILLFAGLVVFRFAYLDQDAPVYQLANVCQEDEPYYSQGAILKLCANEGRAVRGFEKTKGEVFDIYNSEATYLSLKLFGNNYWGLRIPDVIASILFILLMYSIFKVIKADSEFIALFLTMLFANFYLFVFSRYNNPQIFSVLIITLALWVLIKYGYQKPAPLIVLGFISTYAVLFIYPMNFFLLAGIGIFILIKTIQQKRISLTMFFAVGVLFCFLVLLASLHFIGRNLHDMFIALIASGTGESGVLIKTNNLMSIWGNIYRSIVAIIGTAYFRFQLLLLLGVLIAIPILFMKARDKNDRECDISLLMLILMATQFIQNYFAFNYPFKKLLVDIPIATISIFLVTGYFKRPHTGSLKQIAMTICVMISLAVCLFNFKINKSSTYWGYIGSGCYTSTPGWFDVINIVTCVAIALIVLYHVWSINVYNQQFVRIVFMLSILANFILTCEVFIADRKYQIRDCLADLKPLLNNKVVVGGFPFAYQFYNGCKPALHGYNVNYIDQPQKTVLDSMLVNKQADYLIDKVIPGAMVYHKDYPSLTLVKVYNFECYSYYVYKNSLE